MIDDKEEKNNSLTTENKQPTLSNQSQTFFEGDRKLILKATQDGDLQLTSDLLKKDPKLISAKTTTGQSRLLHIAAEAKHLDICSFLLDNNHEVNPVDKDGRTPYQRTECPLIKKLLVARHKKYLLAKHFSMANNEKGPSKVNIVTLGSLPFANLKKSPGANTYSSSDSVILAIGGTIPNNTPGNITLSDTMITVFFREDLLMIPYYGEYSTIVGNELTKQIDEKLADPDFRLSACLSLFKDINVVLELRALCKGVTTVLALFPFLAEFPNEKDPPEILEAKKLFIAQGLMSIGALLKHCNKSQIQELKKFDYVEPAVRQTLMMLPQSREAMTKVLCQEITDKYFSEKDIPSNKP